MYLHLGNATTRLAGTVKEREWVKSFLTFAQARFRGGRFRTPDQVSMFDLMDDSFPAGLTPQVMVAARKEGLQVQLTDHRVQPVSYKEADLSWLRWYQREAVMAGVRTGRGVVWVPTAGGKTEIAIGLAMTLPCRWLFVVNQADLAIQAQERFTQRTGEPAGLIGDGHWDTSHRFTAATFQTLHSRALVQKDPEALAFLRGIQAIAVDEVHTLPAQTFYRVAQQAVNAFYRFGFSGTPMAGVSRRTLYTIGGTARVIYRIRAETLIEDGSLSRPTIHMVPFQHKEPTARSWAEAVDLLLVGNRNRNILVTQLALQAARPGLVYVQRVAHGKILLEYLQDAGLRAELVWGEKTTKARKQAITRLVAGELDFIVCNSVFQTGVDIPPLRSIIVATGGASGIATLQRLGRGLRVLRDAAGALTKSTVECWDIADQGCCPEQGLGPEAHPGCRWMDRHTGQRELAYRSEGFAPTPWTDGSGQRLMNLGLT